MVQITSAITLLLSLGAFTGANACTGPSVNQGTINLVASFEGWRANVYNDPTGNPTVGYGHLCKKAKCAEVPYSIPLTKANGEKLLHSDLKTAQQCITMKTTSNVKLNANQYGALVSWAYNVGCGNVASSTLIKRLNKGESPNTVAAAELPKWNKSGGKVLSGLTRRRNAEVKLFKTKTTAKALPACS